MGHMGQDKKTPFPTGVVGVGVMGSSIVAWLLSVGCAVVAVSPDVTERDTARERVRRHMESLVAETSFDLDIGKTMERLQIVQDFSVLAGSQIVIETVIEDVTAKQNVIRQIEEHVAPQTIIGTNTSALPITLLQQGALYPERIVGWHLSLPVTVSRFMEVMGGDATDPAVPQRVMELGRQWGKDPALLRRDVRGFIANRIGYAMMREAFYLLESGAATAEDIDASMRHSLGTWLPFAGVFRYLDLTGPAIYATVMRDLLPDLSASLEVPSVLKDLVASGGQGVLNGSGFYSYDAEQSVQWQQAFEKFRHALIKVAAEVAPPTVVEE